MKRLKEKKELAGAAFLLEKTGVSDILYLIERALLSRNPLRKEKTVSLFQPKEEKKVEYLELVYDLIFVYIIGRNNSILHNIENGFVSLPAFSVYLLCSLAIIQIWCFSTFYTNMYGRNSIRDHIFMFVNMYLLYYIGEGTRIHWEHYQIQYHIAWALILINVAIQYFIEYHDKKNDPTEKKMIKGFLITLLGEAVIILIAIPVFSFTGIQLAGAAIFFGIGAAGLISKKRTGDRIDFMHLSERAMLFVVFTFGEMIITIASYFEGGFTFSSVYFSGMCFLIVVGLFLCYEHLYNRIIDRDMKTTGLGYMLIHLVLIFALNNITTSLAFMRDEAVSLMPKTILLVISFLLLFGCLLALLLYAKPEMKQRCLLLVSVISCSLIFAGLMFLLAGQMRANILVSV